MDMDVVVLRVGGMVRSDGFETMALHRDQRGNLTKSGRWCCPVLLSR